jgi:hypothetical protein
MDTLLRGGLVLTLSTLPGAMAASSSPSVLSPSPCLLAWYTSDKLLASLGACIRLLASRTTAGSRRSTRAATPSNRGCCKGGLD